jgi:hypothetical protein
MTMLRAMTVVGLLLVGMGCVREPVQGRLDPYAPDQISFSSPDLRNRTAVGTPVVTRDDYGLLYVNVPIRATDKKQLHVDYRATFFDANRQVISETSWATKVLAPNVFDSVSVNSTSPRAADFQVDFRYAR